MQYDEDSVYQSNALSALCRHRPYQHSERERSVFLTERLRLRFQDLFVSGYQLCGMLGLKRWSADRWTTQRFSRQRPVPFKYLPVVASVLLTDVHTLLCGTGQETSYRKWAAQNSVDLSKLAFCEYELSESEIQTARTEAHIAAIAADFDRYFHEKSEPVVTRPRVVCYSDTWNSMPSPVPGRPGTTTIVRPRATVRGSWRFGSVLEGVA